jgi:hypothetical protein
MGNGASASSTTTKVIAIHQQDSKIGKAWDEPSSSRPSSQISKEKSFDRPAPVSLPGELDSDFSRPIFEASKSTVRPSTSHRSIIDGEVARLKENIASLEAQLSSYKDCMILSKSIPPEEQWRMLSSELERLKSLGYNFQDQRQSYFEQTCNAQTQIIQRLERDMAALREESARLKEKCDRRLKRERANSSKKATEVSLQVFELKEQVARLTDSNSLLQRELESAQARVQGKAGSGYASPEQSDCGHTMLILELSTRISELTDELDEAQLAIEALKK